MSEKRSNINSHLNSPGIYKILNKANGKFYIGSAVNLRKRRKNHFGTLEKGTHQNKILLRAFMKYGAEKFEFLVVEFVDDIVKLIEREQYWIDQTGCYKRELGYNIVPIAGSNLGWEMPDEQKELLRKLKTGKPGYKMTEEQENYRVERIKEWYKENGGSALKGIKKSDEFKAKITAGKLNKPLSATHKKTLSVRRKQLYAEGKILNPMTGNNHTEESKAKMSKTKMLSKTIREQSGLPGPGTGKKVSEETRAKQSRIRRGKKLSQEHVSKIVKNLTGRPRSQESRLKTSESLKRWHANNISPMKNRKQSAETRKLMSQNRKKKKDI